MKQGTKKAVCCPNCGAKMVKHPQRLSAGLANVLVKFRAAVIEKNKNDLHVPREVVLDKTEYNNFQKLRYHGLIAKVKTKDGDHISGHWLLTKRGNLFCKNKIKIPYIVWTFRNKIAEKSEKTVGILDVLKTNEPYWDTLYEFSYALYDIMESEIEEDMKADENGNGLLF